MVTGVFLVTVNVGNCAAVVLRCGLGSRKRMQTPKIKVVFCNFNFYVCK
jgi:hypothetical protein